jgi:hypothetical protein
MFLPIGPYDLVKGTKYKIVEDYGNTYIARFVKVVFIHDEWYLMFSKRRNICVSIHCDIYTYVSDNPQEKMERRALNLIVRRLIGDDCFTW